MDLFSIKKVKSEFFTEQNLVFKQEKAQKRNEKNRIEAEHKQVVAEDNDATSFFFKSFNVISPTVRKIVRDLIFQGYPAKMAITWDTHRDMPLGYEQPATYHNKQIGWPVYDKYPAWCGAELLTHGTYDNGHGMVNIGFGVGFDILKQKHLITCVKHPENYDYPSICLPVPQNPFPLESKTKFIQYAGEDFIIDLHLGSKDDRTKFYQYFLNLYANTIKAMKIKPLRLLVSLYRSL